MSKKETEFDRYERMKKLQQQADFQKRKSLNLMQDDKKTGGKSKLNNNSISKNWSKEYELALSEYESEYEEA